MDNLATESIEETQDDAELDQPTEELEVGEEADVEETEADESESDDDDSETEHSGAELLSLDGEEVDLDTVRKWKNGHLMQEDYTRKTQAISEKSKKLAEKSDELDAVVSELEKEFGSDYDPKELEELRDYDPSEYLKRKEQYEARKNKVASARSKAAKVRDELEESKASEERAKLIQANPDWVDSLGNTTAKYQADVDMMNKFLASEGWTSEEVASISTAKQWNIIKKAAKAEAAKANGAALKKKAKKAPTVTKPQSKSAPAPKQRTVGSMLYGD